MRCSECGYKNPKDLDTCKKCNTPLQIKHGSKYKSYPPESLNSPHTYPTPPSEYRPSLYDGLYRLPPEEPRLRLDVLPKILFRPRETFLDIYSCTTKKQGLIAAFILAIVIACISIFSSPDLWSSTPDFQGELNSALFNLIISVPLAVVTIYFVGYLSVIISRNMGSERRDIDKTIGLLGYGGIVQIIMGMVLIIIVVILSNYYPHEPLGESPFIALTYLGVLAIPAIISIIWLLWVSGYAVSVANDIPLSHGILTYFVASLIIGIIITIITEILTFILPINGIMKILLV